MDSIVQAFDNIRVYSEAGENALHKPLLLLLYLDFCLQGRERLIGFREVDEKLQKLFDAFYPKASKNANTHYPFGKLENDGIWQIIDSEILKRTIVGHLHKNELLEKNIKAGFNEHIYQALLNENFILKNIYDLILKKYFSVDDWEKIRIGVRSEGARLTTIEKKVYPMNESMSIDNNQKVGEQHVTTPFDQLSMIYGGQQNELCSEELSNNGYIAYLNSLHSLNADGSNALAESQALNNYFSELYVPFPIANVIKKALIEDQEKVIVLTGHAGDGKSTVALDVYKHLKGLDPNKPLLEKLKEKEEIQLNKRKINIVKDMSELTAVQKHEWLDRAFGNPGSWLIISNTGPLLKSLSSFLEEEGVASEIEVIDALLSRLDTPYDEQSTLEQYTMQLGAIPKPMVVLNMTRLNNVDLGAKILHKMLAHPGWNACKNCKALNKCPLQTNRQALLNSAAIERVRWIYQRLTAYEQRLTLRQIIAHLAFSLTGDIDCKKIHREIEKNPSDSKKRVNLESILFSENFFGYCKGLPAKNTDGFKALELMRRLDFGNIFAANFERSLLSNHDKQKWFKLPETLTNLHESWLELGQDKVGVKWRFALRRIVYIYGQAEASYINNFNVFIDNFLQAPKLRIFDEWQRAGKITLKQSEIEDIRNSILKVLLEFYSGFSVEQFKANDYLYITLRRADREVIQPTQVVLATIPLDDFSLEYDEVSRIPYLSYRDGIVKLKLDLPLLDYIQSRSIGGLGSQLSPIHTSQLEWFRSRLLSNKQAAFKYANKVTLLKANVTGNVNIYNLRILNNDNQTKISVN